MPNMVHGTAGDGELGELGLPGSLPVSYHLIHIGEATRKNHT
jgi:hypothetical protein